MNDDDTSITATNKNKEYHFKVNKDKDLYIAQCKELPYLMLRESTLAKLTSKCQEALDFYLLHDTKLEERFIEETGQDVLIYDDNSSMFVYNAKFVEFLKDIIKKRVAKDLYILERVGIIQKLTEESVDIVKKVMSSTN